MPTVSFEFFPPRGDAATHGFSALTARLAALNPSLMTVTYGAGGGNREGTFECVTHLQKTSGIPCAAHLTYVAHTRDDLFAFTDRLWEAGIRSLVALRGDAREGMVHPPPPHPDYFHTTSDFVDALKNRHAFSIAVGAYPEKHPDAPSLSADIDALRQKCAAGADRAITQFFFDNDIFYRFRDSVRAAGIETPLVPGIMPIAHFPNLVNFAGKCGASIPDWLTAELGPHEPGSPDAIERAGAIAIRQCRDLITNGVDHIHLYTMNRADLCERIVQDIGV